MSKSKFMSHLCETEEILKIKRKAFCLLLKAIIVILTLFRAHVKNGWTIEMQRLLMDPMTLNLSVVRSLSTWNHEVPEMEIQGFLKTVKVSLILVRILLAPSLTIRAGLNIPRTGRPVQGHFLAKRTANASKLIEKCFF